jgi:hypothetical protein
MTCKHEDFNARGDVTFLETSGGYMADVTIQCAQCNLPFQFHGLQPGINMHGAAVSVDGLEARIAISPQGAQPYDDRMLSWQIPGRTVSIWTTGGRSRVWRSPSLRSSWPPWLCTAGVSPTCWSGTACGS